MKYSIEGFNQEQLLKLKITVVDNKNKNHTLKIDGNDIIILRWFVDYYAFNHKKFIVKNNNYSETASEPKEFEYMWVDYNKLLNDLPILDISKQALGDRLDKLTKLGLFLSKQYQGIKNGSMRWLCPTKLIHNLMYNTNQDITEQPYSTTVQINNNTNNYNNINNKLSKDNSDLQANSAENKNNLLKALNQRNKKSLISQSKNIDTKNKLKEIVNNCFSEKTKKEKEICPRTHESDCLSNHDYKRNRYLAKAIEIFVQQSKTNDTIVITKVKDWFYTQYDKGVHSTTSPRFTLMINEVIETLNKYGSEKTIKFIDDTIIANYNTLKYVIQNKYSTGYNKKRLNELATFPGMQLNESLDDYMSRTANIDEVHKKAVEDLKNSTAKEY